MSHRTIDSRGTVSLVALCFVAVLGITLASYLAICTRSMNLSNRSFQSGLGQQLAELGLEEGLRAFNKGDWGGWSANPSGITGGTTAWTLDTTNKRASRTLTFDTTRLGQNVTATVRIRVDNYDANVLGSPYNSSTTYRIGDTVSYTVGATTSWYRCLFNGVSSVAPASSLGYANTNFWAPAPVAWMWSPNTTYNQYDVVSYGSTSGGATWYYYSNATSSSGTVPGVSSNWTRLTGGTDPSGPILAITTFTQYYVGQAGYKVSDGHWYSCITAFTSTGSWDPSKWTDVSNNVPWYYNSGKTYNHNDLVYYSSAPPAAATWYRCTAATSTGNAPTNTAYWENALTGANTTSSPGAHGWSSSSINYNVGDTVCYGSSYSWYRCIRAHTSGSITPTNTTYWATTPLLSQDWQPNRQYSQYDVVRYKGVWYLCLLGASGQIPTNASSGYWAAAPRAIVPWNSATYYEVDDLVNNSGTWYRCIAPHKNQTPPNATYWTVLTGSGSSYVWNAGTAYSAGAYRSYDGVWYKCTATTTANDGHSPNDSGYWSAAWSQPSTGVTTGAPVVYADVSISVSGNPPVTAQLRALIGPAPLFPNAVGSTSTLLIDSAGTVDSYDGSVRAMNTPGATSTYIYNDQANSPFSGSNANIGFGAKLAATGTTSPSLALTNATVKGFVAATPASTSPFAPLATFGMSAYLQNSDGTTTSPDGTATHVDLSRVSRSPYVPVFDTQPAGELTTAFSSVNFARGAPLPNATNLKLGIPGSPVPTRYYYDGDLAIGGGTIATVTIVGPVILYINGDLQITGSTSNLLQIYSTGSAEIHIADSLKIDVGGNGIDNKTLDPKKLILILHTAGTSTQYYQDASTAFYGTIYAPYTTNSTGLYFNSASTTTVHGAISAKKIEFSNNATVHYDSSLRYATFGGVDQPYTVTEWRELPATERATIP